MTQTPSFARLWRRRKQQGWRSRELWIAALLGSTILAATATGLSGYFLLRRLLLNRAQHETRLQIQRHGEQIEAWFATRKQVVTWLARSSPLQTAEATAYLRQEITKFPDFDLFGVVQADDSFFTTLKQGSPPLLSAQNIQEVMNGQEAVSEPFFDNRQGSTRIAIASPIPSTSRQPSPGVFFGAARSQGLMDILANLNKALDSEAIVLDSQGTPLVTARTHTLKATAAELQTLARSIAPTQREIERVEFQGRLVYAAYLPLRESKGSIALIIPLSTLEQDLKSLNVLTAILGGLALLGIYGAIRLVWASEHIRLRAEREALLNRLAGRIRASLDLDKILQATVKEVGSLLYLQRTAFAWFDPQKQIWEIEHELVYPPLPPLNPKVRSLPLTAAELHRKTQGYLAFPVPTQAGKQGYLICLQANRGQWSEAEKELLRAVTDQLAIAITQSHLYQQTQTQLQELQRTQSHLIQREKMSSLGRMVAGIAHEINNPINFIYANHLYVHQYASDLLKLLKLYQQNLTQVPPEIEEFEAEIDWDFIAQDLPQILSSMKTGAERIHNIVLSLRNFSRLDESDLKKVDIHEGIESTLLLLQSRLQNEIATIKNYGNLPKVECYPGQLNQVFMNLLSNSIDAVKALASAGGTITITTQFLEDESPVSVRISIKDNGVGIPEEIQAQIFDPFFTTKPVGQGVGLGLAASYQIVVDLHKGRIEVKSHPGGGTEFLIDLPLRGDRPLQK